MTPFQEEQHRILLKRLIQQEMVECWYYLASAWKKGEHGDTMAKAMYNQWQPEYRELFNAVSSVDVLLFPREWNMRL